MTDRILRAILVGAFALCLSSPAAAANKEHQQMMADIRMLQEQSQQLQILIGQLGDALKAVNQRLDDQTGAMRKAFADQKLTIDTLSNDLRVVREKVDDNNVRISSLNQELDALRQSMAQMASRPTISEADPNGAASSTAPAGAAPSAPPPPPAPGTMVVSPTQLWDAAYSDYAGGQWDLAIQGFEAYIRQFPQSDRADNAQVAIGNALMYQNKYDKAIEAFDTAIRMYPNGDAIPEAYYHKGLSLVHLGQNDRARDAFETCIKRDSKGEAGPAGTLCKQALTGRQ
jgi:TolA-binding protein